MGDSNAKVGYDNTGYEQTMGRHGIGQMSAMEKDLLSFVPTTNLSYEEVFLHTNAYIKQHGYHHTISQKIRLTISASIKRLEDHFRTFVLNEEQMLHQTIIY